jgi:O-6-methylguanine DNA methyltransferase
MRKIKPGTTRSYAELAHRVGAPRAVRAVGTACGRNPIGLVVPCHRVVRTDGGLGGYGWGLDRTRWLLDHERANA